MKLRDHIAVALIGITTPHLMAESPKDTSATKQEVPSVMYQFLGNIMELQPYMTSEKSFATPKARKSIQSRLDQLEKLSHSLHQYDRLKTPNFHISALLLEEELQEAASSYRKSNFSYSRRMLNQSLYGCGSCHMQITPSGNPQWKFEASKIKGSEFERAEFLFATRQYDQSLKLYNSIVDNYDKKANDEGNFELEKSIKRIIGIGIRIKRDPLTTSASVARVTKLQKAPGALKKDASLWSAQLTALQSMKKIDAKKSTADQLINYVATKVQLEDERPTIGDDQMILALYLSGLLYDYINSHPDTELKAGILYWLGVLDSRVDDSFQYDLSNLYLRECILRFPKDPVARSCYREVEEQTLLSYTGSSGINVPDDVRADLDQLRSLIDNSALNKK